MCAVRCFSRGIKACPVECSAAAAGTDASAVSVTAVIANLFIIRPFSCPLAAFSLPPKMDFGASRWQLNERLHDFSVCRNGPAFGVEGRLYWPARPCRRRQAADEAGLTLALTMS
jgi:hypothetical protein